MIVYPKPACCVIMTMLLEDLPMLIKRDSISSDTSIKPLPETELLKQIDRSLAQVDCGDIRDAEEFEAECDAELKEKYGI